MKTNKTTKKSKKKLKPRYAPWVVVGIVLLACVIIPALAIFTDRNDGKNKIESYLEEKYHQDFVVELPSREASGFGVEGYLQSVAYPVGKKELEFITRTSSGGTSDDYPAVLWKEEELPRVELMLKETFGTLPSYKFNIHSMNIFSKRISGSEIPSMSEVMQQYPGELPYRLQIYADSALRDEAKYHAAERLNKVLSFIKQKDVTASVQYIYKNTELNRNEGWSLDQNEIEEIDSLDKLLEKFEVWRAR